MKRPGVSEEATEILADVLELAGVDPSDLSHEEQVRVLAQAYLDAIDQIQALRQASRRTARPQQSGGKLDRTTVKQVAEQVSQSQEPDRTGQHDRAIPVR